MAANLVTLSCNCHVLISALSKMIMLPNVKHNASILDQNSVQNQAIHTGIPILKGIDDNEAVEDVAARAERIQRSSFASLVQVSNKSANHTFHGVRNFGKLASFHTPNESLLGPVLFAEFLGSEVLSIFAIDSMHDESIVNLDQIFTPEFFHARKGPNKMLECRCMLHTSHRERMT